MLAGYILIRREIQSHSSHASVASAAGHSDCLRRLVPLYPLGIELTFIQLHSFARRLQLCTRRAGASGQVQFELLQLPETLFLRSV